MKKYLTVIDKFIYDFFVDLCSFRNKLVVFLCILCWVTRNNGTLFAIATGTLAIVLPFYYHFRSKSECSNSVGKNGNDSGNMQINK